MLLSELCQRYLAYLAQERSRSANTVDSYRRDLLAFGQAMAEQGVLEGEAIDAERLRHYLAHMAKRGAAPSSQRRAASSLRQLFLFGQRQLLLSGNPAQKLLAPKVARSLPQVPSVDEARCLLDALARDPSPRGMRDRCALELLYSCGLRASELCGLRLCDVDLDEKVVRLCAIAHAHRSVPLGQAAAAATRDYLAHGRPALCRGARHEMLVLANSGQPLTRMALFALVRRRSVAAGLGAHISPHTFRHAFAMHLIDNGADLRSVQQMLGHKSIATTEIYVQAGADSLRETIDAHHPLGAGHVALAALGRGGPGAAQEHKGPP